MNKKRTLGIAIAIIGVVLIGFSMYIKTQVLQGNAQIASGQKKLDTTSKVFSFSSATKPFGDQVTKSGNKKIAKGKEEIAYYTKLANQLQVGGIILIVVGAGIAVFSGKKRR
jgi:hypothetical protein